MKHLKRILLVEDDKGRVTAVAAVDNGTGMTEPQQVLWPGKR
ncbi:MAG: hypothetical protein PVJ84_21905 [Desulfobacteraceae bacterium]|jgi:hypothetical protein